MQDKMKSSTDELSVPTKDVRSKRRIERLLFLTLWYAGVFVSPKRPSEQKLNPVRSLRLVQFLTVNASQRCLAALSTGSSRGSLDPQFFPACCFWHENCLNGWIA